MQSTIIELTFEIEVFYQMIPGGDLMPLTAECQTIVPDPVRGYLEAAAVEQFEAREAKGETPR